MKLVLNNALSEIFDGAEIRIMRCFEEHCLPGKEREKHDRNYFSIHFITYGEGTIIGDDGVEHKLKRGDMFMQFPYHFLDYGPSKANPWSYVWLSFEGNAQAEKIFELCGVTRQKPYRRIDNFSKFYPLVINMLEARDCGELQDIKCYGYFLAILCELMKKPRPSTSKQMRLLFWAMSFICSNFTLKLSLQDIASSVCCSQSYLSMLFTKYAKITPIEFQQQFRVAVACDILKKNDRTTVEQVAKRVGYDDPLYFSRVFKKIKGVSPRNYRQDCQDDDPFESIPYADTLMNGRLY